MRAEGAVRAECWTGVSQAERVARVMVPIINVIAIMVYPIGKLMQITSTAVRPCSDLVRAAALMHCAGAPCLACSSCVVIAQRLRWQRTVA